MNIYSPVISGSLTISGSIITTGGGLPLTGSLVSSGSFTSIGPTVVSGSLTVITGSTVEFQVLDTGVRIGNLATDNHNITGSLRISGSITGSNFFTTGTITAQTIVVQTITASVDFITGSTKTGTLASNTHQFTGSLFVTGALYITSGSVGMGTITPKSYSSLTTNGQIISLSNIGIDALQSFRLNNYYNTGTVTDRTISTGYAASIGLDNSNGGIIFNTSLTSSTADNNTTLTERMRITPSGSVGIGTSNPTRPLQISRTSGQCVLSIVAATNDSADIFFGDSSNEAEAVLRFVNGTNTFNILQGGSTRLTINASGSVGIGTTSPFNRLTVQASGSYGLLTLGDNWASDTFTGIKIGAAADTGLAGVDIRSYSYYASSAATSMAIFTNSTGNVLTERMRITTDGDLNLGTYHSNAKFLPGADTNHYVRYLTSLDGLEMSGYSGVMFSTLGGTERVRIGGGGELKITGGGGSNTAFSLYDGGSRRCFFIPSQYYGYMWGCQIVSNGGKMWSFGNDNGSEVGTIVINAGGVAYNTTSDYRLKEDLRDFNGLEKVSAIKVYDFKWKNLDERTNGVLAHELAEVLPYAVSGVKDALNHEGNIEAQSVDYSKLTPVLVKAIQELKSQNDALQARIETLEQK